VSREAKVPQPVSITEQDLLLGATTLSAPRQGLPKNCKTFQDNLDQIRSPCRGRSLVGEEKFRRFLAGLDGAAPELMPGNMNGIFGSAMSPDLRHFCHRLRSPVCNAQLLTINSASSFAALKSKIYSKIKCFVYCKEVFRICERYIRASRPKAPDLRRRPKRWSIRSVCGVSWEIAALSA
jgi:hypothetical protein